MAFLETAAAISAGLGGLSSLVSNATSRSNLRYQYELAQRNWEKQFNMTNEYNLPVNQLARYERAGVNPFVNNNASMSVSAGTNATPQLPHAFNMPLDFATGFSQISQALLAASQATGQGIQNERQSEYIDAAIKKMLSEAGKEDSLKGLNEIEKTLKEKYGGALSRSQIKKNFNEAMQSFVNASLEQEYGPAERELSLFKLKEEGLLTSLSRYYKDEELTEIRTRLKFLESQLETDLEVKRATAQNLRSTAEQAHESAVDARTFRAARLSLYQAEANLTEEQARKIAPEIELLEKENNIFYWRFAADCIKLVEDGIMDVMMFKRLFGAASQGAKALKGAKTQKEAAKAVGDIFDHEAKSPAGGVNWQKLKEQYPDYKTRFPTLSGLME